MDTAWTWRLGQVVQTLSNSFVTKHYISFEVYFHLQFFQPVSHPGLTDWTINIKSFMYLSFVPLHWSVTG